MYKSHQVVQGVEIIPAHFPILGAGFSSSQCFRDPGQRAGSDLVAFQARDYRREGAGNLASCPSSTEVPIATLPRILNFLSPKNFRMELSPVKKVVCWLLLSSLIGLVSCSTITTSKPKSELTQEEIEQQDPLYWYFKAKQSGLGN